MKLDRIATLLTLGITLAGCATTPQAQTAEAPTIDIVVEACAVAGTPTAGDRDGDGISDADEVAGWVVAVDRNGDGDTTDPGETYEVSSHPDSPDTDGDCLSDFEERRGGFDPATADTDGDLVVDFDEAEAPVVYVTPVLAAR